MSDLVWTVLFFAKKSVGFDSMKYNNLEEIILKNIMKKFELLFSLCVKNKQI